MPMPSSLGGTVMEIRCHVECGTQKVSERGCGVGDCSPRFTAQGDVSDGDGTCCYRTEAPCRYVSDTLRPFFFLFFFFFSWTWWWVRSQSLFNSGLTVPMKHSHHTDHYFSSMPFSPITLFTQLVESFY